jgi:heptose I phosphotransferase
VCRVLARADWTALNGVDWPEHIMQQELTDDFHAKQGRSTARWVLQAGGRQLAVYLKRHYRLAWWRGLAATLWPGGNWSPAMQERHNLEWALAQGLPVPAVVAAGEFLGPRGRLQSFLAIEELTGMLPLHEAIPLAAQQLDSTAFRDWKKGLTRELARLARFLHDRHAFHKDFYLCHFFIARADTNKVPVWTNRVYMIDFHRLALHPFTHGFWRSKDLGQLLYSSDLPGIDARDRLRFWRAYLGDDRHTWRGSLLRQLVLLRGRLYRRHNARGAAHAAP